MKSEKLYIKFHWGLNPQEVKKANMLMPESGESLVVLGELEGIQYCTDKGNLKSMPFIHFFENTKPILCCDENGMQLYVVGGEYRVEKEGIVG